jgi:hypothetical protein
LVFGFTHGVWLRLADDDVSERFVGSILKHQLTFDGTDKEFRNIVFSQPEPHAMGEHKNQDISTTNFKLQKRSPCIRLI